MAIAGTAGRAAAAALLAALSTSAPAAAFTPPDAGEHADHGGTSEKSPGSGHSDHEATTEHGEDGATDCASYNRCAMGSANSTAFTRPKRTTVATIGAATLRARPVSPCRFTAIRRAV